MIKAHHSHHLSSQSRLRTADLMASVVRLSGRNRWAKQERVDWERELQESIADDDPDLESSDDAW